MSKLTTYQKKRIRDLNARINNNMNKEVKKWEVMPLRLGGKSRQVMQLNGNHFWIAETKQEAMEIMELMK